MPTTEEWNDYTAALEKWKLDPSTPEPQIPRGPNYANTPIQVNEINTGNMPAVIPDEAPKKAIKTMTQKPKGKPDPQVQVTSEDRRASIAEAYCRDELGLKNIFYPSPGGFYELAGIPDTTNIALFDENGFVIVTIQTLQQFVGAGLWPNGIRAIPEYMDLHTFEELSFLAAKAQMAAANSGKPIMTESPERYVDDRLTMIMIQRWKQQNERCYICHARVDIPVDAYEKQNPMLKIARGMLDNSTKTYDYDNTIIGHYACILAKNAFTMEQVQEWEERFRSSNTKS